MTRRVYIGLQRGGGVIGWLNRLITRSRYGHALIAFDLVSFSADGKKGWGWQLIADFSVPTRWYALDVSALQYEGMLRWCRHRVGAKYDWIGCLKFTSLWRLLFPSRERRTDRKRLFCSEGVYLCALEGGAIRLLGEAEAWEVAPGAFRFSSRLHRAMPPNYGGPTL